MATKKTTPSENKESVQTSVLIAPRMTEKASLQSNANAYTFIVTKDATKLSVRDAIKKEYKVTPKAINIVNLPARNVFTRGRFGVQSGMKKAVVFLKKGDTIAISN
ncbi:MAG: 50S ribosomal protein L23 [Candidatus Pacebacteria bacterium]|nr:50S ribosomal protein L23 [Candidatus Paceibacterota bacterium]